MKNSFTDMFVKNLSKPGRYTDHETKGLNLQVKKTLQKYWVFRFIHGGKRYDLSLGGYPNISLKEARKKAIEARNKLNQGMNPKITTPKEKETNQESKDITPSFKEYAINCHELKKMEWGNKKHSAQWINTLRDYAFPLIGDLPINQIETEHILQILEPIWAKKTETASRLRARIEWVLASATTRKLRSGLNPAIWRGHLETILQKPSKISPVKHHKALPYKELPSFIKEIQKCNAVTALALEFLILNASRTGEVRFAMKNEIHDDIWIIPPERMKMGKEHRVPIGKRSLEIIKNAAYFDQDSPYLFSKNGKPLTNVAMAHLTQKINPDITVHGFRSCFRDWVAEETEHSNEVAEKALAHSVANQVEAAYRRGDLLERRRLLSADWEKYCQTGKADNVIDFSTIKAA